MVSENFGTATMQLTGYKRLKSQLGYNDMSETTEYSRLNWMGTWKMRWSHVWKVRDFTVSGHCFRQNLRSVHVSCSIVELQWYLWCPSIVIYLYLFQLSIDSDWSMYSGHENNKWSYNCRSRGSNYWQHICKRGKNTHTYAHREEERERERAVGWFDFIRPLYGCRTIRYQLK